MSETKPVETPKKKRNVLVDLLLIMLAVAIVLAVVAFVRHENVSKDLAAAKTQIESLFTKEDVDAAVAAGKEGLVDQAAVEAAVAAGKEGLFDQVAMDEAIAKAKEGLFDQAAMDEAVAKAKEGLFDQAAVDKAVADAVAAVPGEDAGAKAAYTVTLDKLTALKTALDGLSDNIVGIKPIKEQLNALVEEITGLAK